LTEFLVQENHLSERGFRAWVFDPEMLYGAARMWWSDRGRRPLPHEGLDLCLYRGLTPAIRRLDVDTRVPAMYDGSVVRLSDDFIGRSVMVACRFPDRPGVTYALYGHTRPRPGLAVGQGVRQGEVVAQLAPVTRARSRVWPHLHVSLGWAPEEVAPERLEWGTIPNVLHLWDPLPALGGAYEVLV
jgi:hypothetical protein